MLSKNNKSLQDIYNQFYLTQDDNFEPIFYDSNDNSTYLSNRDILIFKKLDEIEVYYFYTVHNDFDAGNSDLMGSFNPKEGLGKMIFDLGFTTFSADEIQSVF